MTHRRHAGARAVAGTVAVLLLGGCGSSAGTIGTQGVDGLVIPSPSPLAADFVAPGSATNEWFPLAAGARWTYESAASPAAMTLTVLPATRTVAGVTVWQVRTQVRGVDDPRASTDLVATDRNQNLWLFGHATSDPATSWQVGGSLAAGLLWPSTPRVGDSWRTSQVPEQVDDISDVMSADTEVITPAGTYRGAVVSRLSDRLHPLGTRQISWARGVGPVEFRLGAGELLSLTSYAAGS